jgi:O-antigen ligase
MWILFIKMARFKRSWDSKYLALIQLQQSFTPPSLFWLRLVTVLGVILVSTALAYKGSSDLLKYVLVFVWGFPIIIIFLRRPALGLMATIASGLVVSYTGPGGINVTVGLLVLLIGLWILDLVVFQGEIRIVDSRALPPLYALLLISLLSLGMGQMPWFTYVQPAPLDAQVGGFATYALSFGAFLLFINQIKTLHSLQWITWAFLVFGSVYIVCLLIIRLMYTAGLLTASLQTAFGLIFGGAGGSIFWLWILALTYSQTLFNSDLHPKWRILLIGMVLLTLYILLTFRFNSKSGWVPALIILWVITTLRSWPLGLTILLGGVLVGIPFIPQVLESESYSLSTRLEVLPIFWELIRANPVFGIGFANYHFYTELFSLRGWYTTFNSHNNYVDVAVQTGLLGLVCFLWFLGRVGLLGWQLRDRVSGGFSKAYVNGALGGLVGMVIVAALGDWVLPFVYNIGLSGFRVSVMGWFFLGGLVVLEQFFLRPGEN